MAERMQDWIIRRPGYIVARDLIDFAFDKEVKDEAQIVAAFGVYSHGSGLKESIIPWPDLFNAVLDFISITGSEDPDLINKLSQMVGPLLMTTPEGIRASEIHKRGDLETFFLSELAIRSIRKEPKDRYLLPSDI